MRKKRLIVLVALLFAFTSLSVMPVAEAKTLYNETVEIRFFYYYAVYMNLDQGTELSISFYLKDGLFISFFVADSDNYNSWKNGYHATKYCVKNDARSGSFDWTVPHDDTWYFILDNTDTTPPYATAEVQLTIREKGGGACLGTALLSIIPICALVILGKRRLFS